MSQILCWLLPFLVGLFLAWLICGWFARRSKSSVKQPQRIVEKKVEVQKIVDNPDHLALITKLKNENANYSKQLASMQNNEASVAKTEVVKDNPDHIQRINSLEKEISTLKKGPSIDLVAARAAGIKIRTEDDFAAIEGVGPKINDLIHADGLNTFRELSDVKPARIQTILDNAGPNYQMANPGTWPDQANLAASNRWSALKALQDILDGGVYPDASTSENKQKQGIASSTTRTTAATKTASSPKDGSSADRTRAKESGFRIRGKAGGQDDFTVVEGIGPKINDLIHADGIHYYEELASTEVSRIQNILDKAGPSFRLAKPETWPKQSDLAAKNEWEALRKWQDELDGGKE